MTAYQLTDAGVLRTADSLFIPTNPELQAWKEYLAWAAAGGVPDAMGLAALSVLKENGKGLLGEDVAVEREKHISSVATQLYLDLEIQRSADQAGAGFLLPGDWPLLDALVPEHGAGAADVRTSVLAARNTKDAALAAIEDVYQTAIADIDGAVDSAAIDAVLAAVAWPN